MFLSNGVAEDGHAFYDCGKSSRTITYHAAALAATFTRARQLGLDSYAELAEMAYKYTLSCQEMDGCFIYSQRDYMLLRDQRSYPRYLSMIMYHLLLPMLESNEVSSQVAILWKNL